MNSRLVLTVVVLSLLALLALIGLQRALEEAVEKRSQDAPQQEDAPPAVPPAPEPDAESTGRREPPAETWPAAESESREQRGASKGTEVAEDAFFSYTQLVRHPAMIDETERLRLLSCWS